MFAAYVIKAELDYNLRFSINRSATYSSNQFWWRQQVTNSCERQKSRKKTWTLKLKTSIIEIQFAFDSFTSKNNNPIDNDFHLRISQKLHEKTTVILFRLNSFYCWLQHMPK